MLGPRTARMDSKGRKARANAPLHKSLRTSPAQAAGVTDELLNMSHLCQLIDAASLAKPRGPYKKAANEGERNI